MRITWDNPKRLANLDKHGMDFADLAVDFFADAVLAPANSGRFAAIGRVEGRAVVVIFARLGTEAISVIYMRAANRKERNLL